MNVVIWRKKYIVLTYLDSTTMLYTCNCIPYKIVSTYIQSFFLSWFILENAVLYVHNFSAKCTPPSWIFCDSHTPLKIFFLHMVDSLFIITIWSTAVLEKNVREKIGIWFEVMNMKVSKYIDFEFSNNFPPPFSLQIFIVWGLRRLKRSLHFWDYPNISSVRLFWKMLERNQLIQLNV